MKNNEKMPGNDRDYPESDISENQKQTSTHQQQDQPQNDKDASKEESKPVYIKDMPEIVPARTGVI